MKEWKWKEEETNQKKKKKIMKQTRWKLDENFETIS